VFAGRDKMLNTLHACQGASLQLQYGDDIIENSDHLMAEGIRNVAGL
jgi:hypothetical protein